jgi:hypothetical protein
MTGSSFRIQQIAYLRSGTVILFKVNGNPFHTVFASAVDNVVVGKGKRQDFTFSWDVRRLDIRLWKKARVLLGQITDEKS